MVSRLVKVSDLNSGIDQGFGTTIWLNGHVQRVGGRVTERVLIIVVHSEQVPGTNGSVTLFMN